MNRLWKAESSLRWACMTLRAMRRSRRMSVATYTVAMPPRAIRARTRYRPSTSRPMRGSACGVLTERVYEERTATQGSGAPAGGFDPVTTCVSSQRREPAIRLLLPLPVAVRVRRHLHGLRRAGERPVLPSGDVEQAARGAAVGILRPAVEDPDAA